MSPAISGIKLTVPDTDGSYDFLSLVTDGLNQAPDFVPVTGDGDMLQSVYDPNGDGKVSSAVAADTVPWSGITSAPSLQPLDPDLTELANGGGILRNNGAWEGTLTGEDITAQAITAGLFTASTPFTGDEAPATLTPFGFVRELTPAIAETLTDLQAATIYNVSRWAYVQTGTNLLGHWVYCPESLTASNGTNVVRPNSIASDASPGRWEKIPATSGGGGTEETASSILTKLLTVDGDGSGLDADTLDGQSSAAFQPVDSDLTSIAALTTTSFGRGLLDDADAAAGRTTLGVVIGSNVQAYDADLDDLADGSLTGSKVGTGIAAGNISSGTLATARGGTGVDNSTGGTANTFWARPNGATGAATYRAIVAADIPTLNQNTTGSAATLTTGRSIYGNSFNGSADLAQIIGSAFGGTANGFTKFTGPTTSEKTFTLPNANATIVTTDATQTLTNKRNTQRAASISYAASITPDSDTSDVVNVGTLTGTITINAPTGTPTDGQLLTFRFTQNGTGYAITWNAAFAFGTDVTSALIPTTANAKFEVGVRWNATDSKWRVVALVRGF